MGRLVWPLARVGKGGRFLTLDAMRGVAALAVLMIHMGGKPATFISGGYLAVDFFFCLSGFVLAHAYERSELGVVAFLRLRLIRFYPLYIAGVALGVVSALAEGDSGWRILGAGLFNVLFLPSPVVLQPLAGTWATLYPLNPTAWSLFFELIANAAWFGARRRLSGWTAGVVLVGGIAAFVVSDLAFGTVSTGQYWEDIAGGFGRVAFGFLAGVLTYRLWRASAPRFTLPIWVPAALLTAILCAPLPRHVVDAPMVLLLVPPVVFLGACCEPQGAAVVSLSRVLGDASYAVYALHYPIIVLVDRFVVLPTLAHRSLVTTPLTLVLVVGLSLWLDRVYDRPVRRYLLRRGAARAALGAAGVQ